MAAQTQHMATQQAAMLQNHFAHVQSLETRSATWETSNLPQVLDRLGPTHHHPGLEMRMSPLNVAQRVCMLRKKKSLGDGERAQVKPVNVPESPTPSPYGTPRAGSNVLDEMQLRSVMAQTRGDRRSLRPFGSSLQ